MRASLLWGVCLSVTLISGVNKRSWSRRQSIFGEELPLSKLASQIHYRRQVTAVLILRFVLFIYSLVDSGREDLRDERALIRDIASIFLTCTIRTVQDGTVRIFVAY